MLVASRRPDEPAGAESPVAADKQSLLDGHEQRRRQQFASPSSSKLVAPHPRPTSAAADSYSSPLARKLVNDAERTHSARPAGERLICDQLEPLLSAHLNQKPGRRRGQDVPQVGEAGENRESDQECECREADLLPAPVGGGNGGDRTREGEAEAREVGRRATANNVSQRSCEGAEEKGRARLARQESTFERDDAPAAGEPRRSPEKRNRDQRDQDSDPPRKQDRPAPACFCSRMLRLARARKFVTIPVILLVIYCAAIYCLPFIEIDPKIPNELPAIPFDFHEGPLRPSSASAFKFKHLFRGQVSGPESLAFDSDGNLYTAIEGGFVLYARLNESSPIKRFLLAGGDTAAQVAPPRSSNLMEPWRQPRPPELVKIAELNGLRHTTAGQRSRSQRADESAGGWRRECQLDEKVYGSQLFTTTASGLEEGGAEGDKWPPGANFKTNVRVSRCSKPLGLRLSRDESSLYVIDTLAGLFRVNLRAAERPHGAGHPAASQRQLVTKLIDFRANNGHQVLPAIQLEDEHPDGQQRAGSELRATRLMNVSLKALDDLVLDRRGDHDLIYMTVASQTWPATSFVYDVLEGRPSGLVLRFDTADNQLVVLEPRRVALVRTSAILAPAGGDQAHGPKPLNKSLMLAERQQLHQPSWLLGSPRLDEDDTFDDRPLNFPNGLELTDDRQALLIADTSNKRIIRHYVRGPRRGTSDLWAWTPMFPDNIRRGYERQRETYWVVGCGRGPSPAPSAGAKLAGQSPDILALLRTWPRLRKFLLKNIYFLGYLVEFMGANLFASNRIQDAGYELRTGSSLCASGCSGMMIIQYNAHGDVIRSIHSREFPNDLAYYSQVNEVIDPQTREHALYLGSPSYEYLTKLILPAESRVHGPRRRSQHPEPPDGRQPAPTLRADEVQSAE